MISSSFILSPVFPMLFDIHLLKFTDTTIFWIAFFLLSHQYIHISSYYYRYYNCIDIVIIFNFERYDVILFGNWLSNFEETIKYTIKEFDKLSIFEWHISMVIANFSPHFVRFNSNVELFSPSIYWFSLSFTFCNKIYFFVSIIIRTIFAYISFNLKFWLKKTCTCCTYFTSLHSAKLERDVENGKIFW